MKDRFKYSFFKGVCLYFLLIFPASIFSQEVLINEVFTSPPPGLSSSGMNTNSLYNLVEIPPDNLEWIELYNPHPCDSVDISCYIIGSNTNSVSAGKNWGAFTFPSGTVIPPLGFIIVGGNNSQVPILDFNINNYTPDLGVVSLDGDSARWFLRDSWGWIALYNAIGNPVNAVYWSQINGPPDLYTELEYANDIDITTSCSGQISLDAAVNIPNIEYGGYPISSSVLSLQRIRDADTVWHVTPQTPTPRACNAKCILPPIINLNVKNAGCGNKNGSIVVNITDGGTGPYTIVWNTGHSGDSITALPPGKYIVTITDKYNCFVVKDSVVILDMPGPDLLITNIVHETCSEQNASAEVSVSNGSGPFAYLWSSNPPQSTADIMNVGAGTYYVTVTDINGCSATESVIINNHLEPQIELIDLQNDICGKGSGSARVVVLQGTLPYEYIWSTTPAQNDSIVSNLSPGTYTVSVSDGICTVSIAFTISEIPRPVADFSFSPNVVYLNKGNCSFTDESTPVVWWKWDFGDGSSISKQNPVHKYFETGDYMVTLLVKDEFDCYDSTHKYVSVREKTTFFVPNAFTPNNNGMNDEFKAIGINVLDFEMYVFSRWGDQLFYSNDIEKGWDGSMKGDPAPADVYTYLITYTADVATGGYEEKRMVGKVVLLR